MNKTDLLIVDDDLITREMLREVFAREGRAVALASSAEEALQVFGDFRPGVVVTDIRMAEQDGFSLLRRIHAVSAETPVILMTGFGSMEGALQAVRDGAFDYVSKPFRLEEMKSVVARAFKHLENREGSSLARAAENSSPESRPSLIGRSPAIVDVYKIVARAAQTTSSVLILGESGTGKELIARAIHDNGARAARPFVAINCGALAENLLESELFGHKKGAFTGAIADKPGLLQEAEGGTLFLDEIGDIPASLQVRLLRVLQEGEYRPVGSNQALRADIRVIAATHRHLETLVKEEKFREDLFYRLKVLEIRLPPLRDRLEDLPELISHFLSRYSRRNGKSISHVSDSALEMLTRYPWPGNIRELEHAIERAVAMASSSFLECEDFPEEVRARPAMPSSTPASLEETEKSQILRVLAEEKGNRSRAAEKLGIDRVTLYRKLQKYGEHK